MKLMIYPIICLKMLWYNDTKHHNNLKIYYNILKLSENFEWNNSRKKLYKMAKFWYTIHKDALGRSYTTISQILSGSFTLCDLRALDYTHYIVLSKGFTGYSTYMSYQKALHYTYYIVLSKDITSCSKIICYLII